MNITKTQTRTALWEAIKPVLQEAGFERFKNDCAWRVASERTDVVKIAFLRATEVGNIGLPDTTFSVLYGCYFHFIPAEDENSDLSQYPGVITPDEMHCHLRRVLKRPYKDRRAKGHDTLWRIDKSIQNRQKMLNALSDAIRSSVIPFLDEYESIENLLAVLKSEAEQPRGLQVGIGAPDSLQRNFLLGFAARRVGDRVLSQRVLELAKRQVDEMMSLGDVPHEANRSPLYLQQQSIGAALADLEAES